MPYKHKDDRNARNRELYQVRKDKKERLLAAVEYLNGH